MKKAILASLLLATAVFAKTETMELTGVYSEQMGNPFKKVLNINKTKSINIYSEDKDVVLKVESNLDRGFTSSNEHPSEFVFKNKTVENVLEDFYSEDFIVAHALEDAKIVNVISGDVSLTYSNAEERSGVHHLSGIEITLLVSVNGVEKKITMDQTLGKKGQNYDWVISANLKFNVSSLKEKVQKIIETQLYVAIQEKDKK
jgi:hypothetical protein